MEVRVTDHPGLEDDAIVSIRFGNTRRQAPVEALSAHPLRFPEPVSAICEPMKIDVLQPITSTRLVLQNRQERYWLRFKQDTEATLGLHVKDVSGGAIGSATGREAQLLPDVDFKTADGATAANSAREYLEAHGLLRYVQALLHAVIQVRPEDPYDFMIDQLAAARGPPEPRPERTKLPIAGEEAQGRNQLDDEGARQNVAELVALQANNRSLQAEKDSMARQLEKLQAALKDEKDKTASELAKLRADKATTASELLKLKAEKEGLQAEKDAKATELEKLQACGLEKSQAESSGLQEDNTKTASELKRLQAENLAKTSQCQELQAEILSLQGKIDAQEENGRMASELERLQKQNEVLQTYTTKTASELERLKAENRGLQEEQLKTASQHQELQAEFRSLQGKIDATSSVQAESSGLKEANGRLASELERLRARNGELQTCTNNSTSELERLRIEHGVLQEEKVKTTSKCQALEAQVLSLQGKIDAASSVQAESSVLQERKGRMASELERQKAQNDELQTSTAGLKDELTATKALKEEMSTQHASELGKVLAENARLREELAARTRQQDSAASPAPAMPPVNDAAAKAPEISKAAPSSTPEAPPLDSKEAAPPPKASEEPPLALSLRGGDGFVEIGEWRVGMVNEAHFSCSHKSGNTSVIFRSDGTLNPGPRTDFGLWKKPAGLIKNVLAGEALLQFGGSWRLGAVDGAHCSISHKSGKTAMVWNEDGTQNPGPLQDLGTWKKPLKPSKVHFGDRFIQLGDHFRIGDVDGGNMSVGNVKMKKTCVIYRSDGTIQPGPCNDFGLWDRAVRGEAWRAPQPPPTPPEAVPSTTAVAPPAPAEAEAPLKVSAPAAPAAVVASDAAVPQLAPTFQPTLVANESRQPKEVEVATPLAPAHPVATPGLAPQPPAPEPAAAEAVPPPAQALPAAPPPPEAAPPALEAEEVQTKKPEKESYLGELDTDSLRFKLRQELEAAWESGHLRDAIMSAIPQTDAAANVSTEQGPPQSSPRLQIKQELERAFESGRLTEALQAATAANDGQGSQVSAETLRVQLREGLEAATNNGRLAEAFQMAATADVAAENGRCKVAAALERAVNDGSLDEALRLAAAKAETVSRKNTADLKAEPQLSEAQRKALRENLEQALLDGSLSGHLANAVKPTSMAAIPGVQTATVEAEVDSHLEGMRLQIKEDLEKAVVDGSLSEALIAAEAESPLNKQVQEQDALRFELKGLMNTAMETGQLEEVLGSILNERRSCAERTLKLVATPGASDVEAVPVTATAFDAPAASAANAPVADEAAEKATPWQSLAAKADAAAAEKAKAEAEAAKKAAAKAKAEAEAAAEKAKAEAEAAKKAKAKAEAAEKAKAEADAAAAAKAKAEAEAAEQAKADALAAEIAKADAAAAAAKAKAEAEAAEKAKADAAAVEKAKAEAEAAEKAKADAAAAEKAKAEAEAAEKAKADAAAAAKAKAEAEAAEKAKAEAAAAAAEKAKADAAAAAAEKAKAEAEAAEKAKADAAAAAKAKAEAEAAEKAKAQAPESMIEPDVGELRVPGPKTPAASASEIPSEASDCLVPLPMPAPAQQVAEDPELNKLKGLISDARKDNNELQGQMGGLSKDMETLRSSNDKLRLQVESLTPAASTAGGSEAA